MSSFNKESKSQIKKKKFGVCVWGGGGLVGDAGVSEFFAMAPNLK